MCCHVVSWAAGGAVGLGFIFFGLAKIRVDNYLAW